MAAGAGLFDSGVFGSGGNWGDSGWRLLFIHRIGANSIRQQYFLPLSGVCTRRGILDRCAAPGAAASTEDLVYIGLGLLLVVAAFTLLATAMKSVVQALWNHALGGQVVGLLDQILLVLLVIELLYTVQVSFRERGLVAEPFLVVALIAVIRRVLVLTAEMPKLPDAGEVVFRHAMLELGVLTVMVLVLVGSLIMLQKYAKRSV